MFDKDLLESFKATRSFRMHRVSKPNLLSLFRKPLPGKRRVYRASCNAQKTIRGLARVIHRMFLRTLNCSITTPSPKPLKDMGYKGIYTEGIEKILGEKSPNYIYTPKGTKKIRVLLRNYKLTDDIGFRFSARWWPEWPLTADKYARWLAETKGRMYQYLSRLRNLWRTPLARNRNP